MEFGLFLPQVGRVTWDQAVRAARNAESAGFDSLWLVDHALSTPPSQGILEPWTMLSALAPVTERVGLGVQVLCQSFRNPAMMAKMATTFQNISGGRLRFMIGAGYVEAEYQAFGYDFPSPGGRFEQLRDTVRICRGMWESGTEPFSYVGKRYFVDAVVNAPPPVSPILLGVGGTGDRVLNLTAAEADEWNNPASALSTFGERKRFLDSRLEVHGRQIRCTQQVVFAPGTAEVPTGLQRLHPDLGLRGSLQQMVDRVCQFASDGVSGLFGLPTDRRAVDAIAEALPELRQAVAGV